MKDIDRIKELVKTLNYAAMKYYQEDTEIIATSSMISFMTSYVNLKRIQV